MEGALKNLDPVLQVLILISVFTLIPFILITTTSFLRFAIVLSLLKQAMGTQQVPPSMVIVGLSVILTMYTMAPVFSEMLEVTKEPYKNGAPITALLAEASRPLKDFMMKQTQQKDLGVFIEINRKGEAALDPDDVSFLEIAPAFLINELRTAFEISFIMFIPFIVIDLVISNILLALGMMMLSPTIISLPFKILIFVAVDGWGMLINGLVQSYN